MTTENVKQSLKDWITAQTVNHSVLSGIPIILNGEITDAVYPLIGIVDQGSATVEQDGVIMHGVEQVTLDVVIHSIPVTEEQEGTDIEDHREIQKQLYRILADRKSIAYLNGMNETTIFDIRCSGPTMEPQAGLRETTFQMLVIACPLNP